MPARTTKQTGTQPTESRYGSRGARVVRSIEKATSAQPYAIDLAYAHKNGALFCDAKFKYEAYFLEQEKFVEAEMDALYDSMVFEQNIMLRTGAAKLSLVMQDLEKFKNRATLLHTKSARTRDLMHKKDFVKAHKMAWKKVKTAQKMVNYLQKHYKVDHVEMWL
jgi:hypothetical protein